MTEQELLENIIDIHTHYGPFGGFSFSPKEVMQKMRNIGIKKYAIMPAPMKNDNHIPDNHKVLEFMNQEGVEVIPILMTSPAMIKNDPLFKEVNNIPYKIIKIHPYAHNWNLYPDLVEVILKQAQLKNVPVMIHTGMDESQPNNFKTWFKNYPNIQFILAHGRPANQTKEILETYSNVWVDISFIEIKDIEIVSTEDNTDRILFGTDLPIPEIFFETSSEEYYNNRIKALIDNFGTETILKWGKYNTEKVLDIENT